MSKQTSETSDEICKAIGGIADGSVNQVNEIDKTISIMDNLSLNINNIISNVTKATTMTNETKNIGDKSLSIVKELDDKNTNTNNVMNEITSNIDDLTDSIREIEKVIELIKGISEQTNLLSLNASIEAARAGESRKGFAVVAEEVKKLSDESRRSTESVGKVIRNVYNKANYTKNLLDSSTVIFSEQNEAVKFTSESFKNINYSIVNITNEIRNIEKLMNEIKEKKSKTLDSVNDIRIIIENSSASVEEVLAATQEQTAGAEKLDECSKKLTETMTELQENLNIFKIKNN